MKKKDERKRSGLRICGELPLLSRAFCYRMQTFFCDTIFFYVARIMWYVRNIRNACIRIQNIIFSYTMWSALWSLEKYVIHTQCKTDIDMHTNFTTSLLLLVRVSQNTLGVFRFFFYCHMYNSQEHVLFPQLFFLFSYVIMRCLYFDALAKGIVIAKDGNGLCVQ